jgi:cytosine/creatinine deaminase
VGADRAANWSAEDVRARMTFGLRSAYAHGTRAIRTHLDSLAPQDAISFGVFRNCARSGPAGSSCRPPASWAATRWTRMAPSCTADIVAASGGVLGMVTYPIPDLKEKLLAFFRMASRRAFHADFHVDETGDPSVATCG